MNEWPIKINNLREDCFVEIKTANEKSNTKTVVPSAVTRFQLC